MRFLGLISAALILLFSGPASGQGWIEYIDREQFFSVNLPEEPTVEDTTYTSQAGESFPARVYTAEQGRGRYKVTVVDYSDASVPGVRGSIAWAAWNYRKDLREAGGEITYDAFAQIDRIEGHQLQITNADRGRTFVAIHQHARRLYILDATVPPGSPPPALFQASLRILDEEGNRIRYNIDADGQRIPSRGN